MDFTIISLGNVEFLSMILNGVAMICGTGNFARLVSIGFLIGLLFIGFQCIMQGGQRINLHHTLLCFICYLCMFGPSCNVNIEDAYSGAVRRVDNLPLGVGVAGTAISGIGYGVTKLMEQGYADFDRTTEHEFNEPLRILNKFRAVAARDEIFHAIDLELGARANGAASDSKQALVNYISECTMAKIQLGGTTPQKLYTTGWGEEWQFTSLAHTVYLPIAGLANETVSCNDGFAHINSMLAKFSTSQVRLAVNRQLHIRTDDGTGAVADDLTKMENAMEALNATMNGAQDFMQMALVQGVYDKAAQKYYITQQDQASAIALNQAIIQRNSQWAAEGSMFISTARALMAFFEGFIYAITPIVAFLIAIGTFGVSLVGKYFLTIVWIQLWLPILSIVNLYVMTGARSALVDASVGASASFYALDVIWQETQTWIATGGMLAAAAPMLALFLVTGSTYAFTTLAGRMGGQDHYNERIATPDVVAPSAMMNHAPHYTADRTTGVVQMGANAVLPSLQLGQAFTSNVSSKEALVNGQAQATSAAISQAIGNGMSSAQSNQFTQQVGSKMASSNDESFQASYQKVANQMRAAGYTDQQIQAGAAQAAMTMGGHASLSGSTKATWLGNVFSKLAGLDFEGGVSASTEKSMKQTDTTQASQSHEESSSRALSASESKQFGTSLQKAYHEALTKTSSKEWSQLAKMDEGSNIGMQFRKMADARQSYEQAQSMSKNYGTGQNIGYAALSESLLFTQAGQELSRFTRTHALSDADRAQIQRDAGKFERAGFSQNQAAIAASIKYMNDHQEHHGELVGLLGQSRYFMGDYGGVNPTQNQGLRRPGNADEFVAAHRDVQNEQRADIQSQNPGQVNMAAGADNVKSHFTEGKGTVQTQAARDNGTVMKTAKDRALEELVNGQLHGLGFSGLGIDATSVMRDGFMGAFARHFNNKDATKLPPVGEKSLSAFLLANQRTLTGFTSAQEKYFEAYHARRAQDPENIEGVASTIQGLQRAALGVRDEMRHALFGNKENLTTAEQQKVDIATTSMLGHIHALHENDFQGLTTQVTNFNTAYNLKPAVAPISGRVYQPFDTTPAVRPKNWNSGD